MRWIFAALALAGALALGGCANRPAARDHHYGHVSHRFARDRARYSGLIDDAARGAGVPVQLAHAVITVESGYNARMRGGAGEYGLGQIKCPTARDIGFRGSCRTLFDPQTNLRWSMRYLAKAIAKGGRGCAGLSLYQRGVGAHPRCTSYGRRVLGAVRRYP